MTTTADLALEVVRELRWPVTTLIIIWMLTHPRKPKGPTHDD